MTAPSNDGTPSDDLLSLRRLTFSIAYRMLGSACRAPTSTSASANTAWNNPKPLRHAAAHGDGRVRLGRFATTLVERLWMSEQSGYSSTSPRARRHDPRSCLFAVGDCTSARWSATCVNEWVWRRPCH